MDFFQHRYYKINKILMTLSGQWPYQNIRVRHGLVVATLTLGGYQLIPLLTALVRHCDDGRILLDGAQVLLFAAVAFTKLIGFLWNSKKTLQLLNRIPTDWHEWAQDPEIDILRQYAEKGRKMTLGYLVMSIINHNVFMTQPAIPKIIDVFLKNGTEPGKFPYPVDYYYFDIQKYYFYVIVFAYICICPPSVVVTINGIMLISYVQHACGIFAALGHKLERLGNNQTLVETGETRYALDKKNIAIITSCIDRHNDAIEYVNLIAASYSWVFFFTIGFGTILLNIIGLQILLRMNDTESITRSTVFLFTLAGYFCVDCYISQTVTDHAISLYFCLYNNQWYKLSLKAQKLLQFMVMRCSIPCILTAGKMLVMSRRNYWQTTRTAISYLGLLRTMREI